MMGLKPVPSVSELCRPTHCPMRVIGILPVEIQNYSTKVIQTGTYCLNYFSAQFFKTKKLAKMH